MPSRDQKPPQTELHIQRLDVYRLALELNRVCDDLLVEIPKGKAHLADQLARAAASVACNVAEGAGEFSRREKARFLRMALRSATECAAVIDLLEAFKLTRPHRVDEARMLLVRVVSMLTKMVKRLTDAGGEKQSG